VQIRRVRYSVRRATQALTARRVPGGPLLVHKLLEARYRHHAALLEAARRHSGLPPAPFRVPTDAAPPRAVEDSAGEVSTRPIVTPPEGIPAQVESAAPMSAMAVDEQATDGRSGEEDGAPLAAESRTLTFR